LISGNLGPRGPRALQILSTYPEGEKPQPIKKKKLDIQCGFCKKSAKDIPGQN